LVEEECEVNKLLQAPCRPLA